MRWSQLLIPTLKETPAEAEIVSHKLLLRAGLARKLTGGLYTFLPMGLRVLQRIQQIVREEMNRAGAQEVLMPALQPTDIWKQSERYDTASDVLFKVSDRAEKEWVLGPTHEEVITTLVAGEISSYRQMPCNFYQIQTKFRDEIRPRFGLMRAKEFIMKDAYSFDVSDDAASASYEKMYDAYGRIFKRCGLKALPVEADSGVIGGKFSHEFMVPAETGEDDVVYCESGEYAANIEKATSKGPITETPQSSTGDAPEKFETPGVTTIEALAKDPYKVAAHEQIKTLVYIVNDQVVLVLMRGDDQLNEAKFAGQLGTTTFRAASAGEIFEALGAHPGSLGAVNGVAGNEKISAVYADKVLRGAAGMTTGANEDGYHLRHVEIDRDISGIKWHDLRTVQAGEACTVTEKPLKIQRGIEVGHVFKLGTKYSEALNAMFLDEGGKEHPCVMGCYGIGVTRTMQAVIEQSNDKWGVIWPVSVAPFQICLTPLNADPGSEPMRLAEQYHAELAGKGYDVILDDRNERPGFKFKDSELVGIPVRLAIGEKSLANGEVELKQRGGELQKIGKHEAVAKTIELVESLRAELEAPLSV
ncbi:MAG: proline--tRNA ligase [Verrucomicrobiales bacterium]|nr:proline--tRNA ligase [Verrucomicrobiales bacterium]|tara:strand:+ start:4281 stop:6041 length:1761 start_codon:yes stop_codon:yes gene_type:complete